MFYVVVLMLLLLLLLLLMLLLLFQMFLWFLLLLVLLLLFPPIFTIHYSLQLFTCQTESIHSSYEHNIFSLRYFSPRSGLSLLCQIFFYDFIFLYFICVCCFVEKSIIRRCKNLLFFSFSVQHASTRFSTQLFPIDVKSCCL